MASDTTPIGEPSVTPPAEQPALGSDGPTSASAPTASSESTALGTTDGATATDTAWDGYDRRKAHRRIHEVRLAQGDVERREYGHDRRDPQSAGAKARPVPVPSLPWQAPQPPNAGPDPGHPTPAEAPPVLPGHTEPIDPTKATPFT